MEIRPILSALLRSKTGAVLIAAQVALTVAIVANAAFIIRGRLAAAERPSGVDEANVFSIAYVGARKIDDRLGMRRQDLDTLRAIPGVTAATSINMMPMSESGWQGGLVADKARPESGAQVAMYMSDADLIPALGLHLVEGRNFEPGEIHEVDDRIADPDADAVLVTRHLAATMFPGATSVVGKSIYDGTTATATALRIVGVVDSLISPWAPTSGEAYDSVILPVRYLGNRAQYVVRTEPGQLARVMAAAEKELTALRNDRVHTATLALGELRDRRYRRDRTGAGMLLAVAIGLLVVTGSGIVGVASLWVGQRKKQIGVRRALGAGRLDILRYFVTENLMITTVGVAVGAALAIALDVFLARKLGMARLPVGYIAGSVVALWALGIAAVLGPAWRAAAVPPAIATRSA